MGGPNNGGRSTAISVRHTQARAISSSAARTRRSPDHPCRLQLLNRPTQDRDRYQESTRQVPMRNDGQDQRHALEHRADLHATPIGRGDRQLPWSCAAILRQGKVTENGGQAMPPQAGRIALGHQPRWPDVRGPLHSDAESDDVERCNNNCKEKQKSEEALYHCVDPPLRHASRYSLTTGRLSRIHVEPDHRSQMRQRQCECRERNRYIGLRK